MTRRCHTGPADRRAGVTTGAPSHATDDHCRRKQTTRWPSAFSFLARLPDGLGQDGLGARCPRHARFDADRSSINRATSADSDRAITAGSPQSAAERLSWRPRTDSVSEQQKVNVTFVAAPEVHSCARRLLPTITVSSSRPALHPERNKPHRSSSARLPPSFGKNNPLQFARPSY